MTVFEWYLLFCITTGLAAFYELLMPVFYKEVEVSGKVENAFIISATFFVITVLIAPLVFISCISPKTGEVFRENLYQGLFPKQ
jgi:hypothetical protein